MFSGFELWPMEEGRQYSEYLVESNPRAYMTMRDYRNLASQNQQPWERNPNPPRSMRDYRDQGMSAPSYMVPPQYTSTPQPPQPPQLISLIKQAILDLTKLVGNFVEAQRTINAQLSQKIDTMENNVNKRIDGLQSEMEQKLENLQYSISKLANQLVHQEEENLEGEWLSDQEELMQELVEAPEELRTGEAREEPQEPILQPIPMNLNPTAAAQATKFPLLVAPYTDQVYILPSPVTQPTPKTPTTKATSIALHVLQKFKKLGATVQAFATTSKTIAAAHTARHSGWFGCQFRFGAPEPQHL